MLTKQEPMSWSLLRNNEKRILWATLLVAGENPRPPALNDNPESVLLVFLNTSMDENKHGKNKANVGK